MAKQIQVTPEELINAAGRIESLAAEYQKQYNNLYSETNAMSSTWNGEDNVAFVNQIAGFQDDFVKMHQLMINYATFLRNSAKAYSDTQQAIINQAKKLIN